MLRALQAEVLKLKGSRMPFWTGSVVLLAPLLTLAAARGRPGGAALLGWTAFMRSGAQLIAGVYGIMLFGLVAAYLFGREYVEGTANEMLTLPLRRESFIVAKMVVLAVWVLALTVFSMAAQAVYAALVGVGGPSWGGLASVLLDDLTVSLLVFATLPVVALLAMVGRGYLAPMTYSAIMAAAGLGLAEAGWSRWFPWSMPMAVTGIALGPQLPMPGLVPASWAVALGLFAGGLATLFWFADRGDSAQ